MERCFSSVVAELESVMDFGKGRKEFRSIQVFIFDWPGLDNSFKNSFSLVVSQ